MKIFSTAFSRFKKDGLYIVLLDAITIILIVALLIGMRGFLEGLVFSVEAAGTGLASITGGEVNREMLAETIGQLEPLILRYNLVFYLLFPLVLFIIAVILQGMSFGVAQERSKKVYNARYLARFGLFTLPGFLVALWIATLVVEVLGIYLLPELANTGIEEFASKSRLLGWIGLLILVVSYFTIIAYGMLLHDGVKKAFKQMFALGIKRWYVFLPILLAFAVLKLLMDNSLLMAVFNLATGELAYIHILLLIVFLAGFAYLKIINALLVRRYQQES